MSIADADLHEYLAAYADPAEDFMNHPIFGILRADLKSMLQEASFVRIARTCRDVEVEQTDRIGCIDISCRGPYLASAKLDVRGKFPDLTGQAFCLLERVGDLQQLAGGGHGIVDAILECAERSLRPFWMCWKARGSNALNRLPPSLRVGDASQMRYRQLPLGGNTQDHKRHDVFGRPVVNRMPEEV